MAEEAPQQQEEPVDPFSLFSDGIRQAVEGLSFIGQISETVQFAGHTFGLKTLRPQEKYAIALVHQPYRNTLYSVQVWRNAHVAACLTHVDGNQHFCDPIGPDIESFIQARLNYISNPQTGWFDPVLDFLFSQYALLEATAGKAVQQLNFLSNQNQEMMSPAWQDSLTEQGSLGEETPLASQPFTNFSVS